MTPKQRHARWRAQHASQHLPVRRREAPSARMTLVIGDVSMNNAARVWAGDECCDTCGHYVCSCAKRGPCAPAAPPPAPVAGEAREQQAGGLVEGDRVECVRAYGTSLIRGEHYTVAAPCVSHRRQGLEKWVSIAPRPGYVDGFPLSFFKRVEPAPSPAVEPANAFDHAAAVIAAHDRAAVERARGAR